MIAFIAANLSTVLNIFFSYSSFIKIEQRKYTKITGSVHIKANTSISTNIKEQYKSTFPNLSKTISIFILHTRIVAYLSLMHKDGKISFPVLSFAWYFRVFISFQLSLLRNYILAGLLSEQCLITVLLAIKQACWYKRMIF